MKTKMLWVSNLILLCVIMLTGCEGIFQEVADPNSGLNIGVDSLSDIIPVAIAGSTVAVAGGLPWAAVVLLITNVVSVVIGAYKNHRKNIVIGEQDSMYNNTKETTKAIIEAIDDVSAIEAKSGETIGDIVKRKVEEKLKKKDYYLVGKAIISSLKGE